MYLFYTTDDAYTDKQLKNCTSYSEILNLLNEKLSSSPNNDEICSLFNRCEEDIQRMNNLSNIHGVTFKDLSTYKSAIKSLKIKASQCI